MKQLLIMAMVASSTIGFVAATSQANAGFKNGDYAKEYCQYYKNKAVWSGDPDWWAAYYACIKDNR